MRILIQVGYLKESEANKLRPQYTEFIYLRECKSKFQDFNIHKGSVDECLFEKMTTTTFPNSRGR